MWVNVFKNVFGYYIMCQFNTASLQWFFIGYWILQTRLDFYPAFLFITDFADYKDVSCLLLPVSCTLHPVSCILHLASCFLFSPPHQAPVIEFPLGCIQWIYILCIIPWVQLCIRGVSEDMNILSRHITLGQHKNFSAISIFRHGYNDNCMAGKTALYKYITGLNVANLRFKLPA